MGFKKEDIVSVNKTARTKGAIGGYPYLPKLIVNNLFLNGSTRLYCSHNLSILDYGAGPKATSSAYFLDKGYRMVTSWDIGENFNPEVHDPNALSRNYDLVMMSNVVNVLPSLHMLRGVFSETSCLGKLVVFNYPNSPRKLDINYGQLHKHMGEFFTVIWRMKYSGYSGDVYFCLSNSVKLNLSTLEYYIQLFTGEGNFNKDFLKRGWFEKINLF